MVTQPRTDKTEQQQTPMLRPLATLLLLATPVAAAELQDLQQLLEDKSCQGCALNDADLVHAELSGAQLQQAQLQGPT